MDPGGEVVIEVLCHGQAVGGADGCVKLNVELCAIACARAKGRNHGQIVFQSQLRRHE